MQQPHPTRVLGSAGGWRSAVFLRPDGRPLSLNAVSKAFQVSADRFVAFEAGRSVLRHAWVSNQLAKGSPAALVSKQAGHASMSFTVDHYGHVTAEAACQPS